MRDPVGFKVQCFQNVFFGLVTGSLYSDLGDDQRAYSVSMVILLILINNAMATAAQKVLLQTFDKKKFSITSALMGCTLPKVIFTPKLL